MLQHQWELTAGARHSHCLPGKENEMQANSEQTLHKWAGRLMEERYLPRHLKIAYF
jgi:hypothetical protein